MILYERGKTNQRNGGIKVSQIVDLDGVIYSLVFGDSNLQDSEMFREHLKDLKELISRGFKIISLYRDGAYDSFWIFRELKELMER